MQCDSSGVPRIEDSHTLSEEGLLQDCIAAMDFLQRYDLTPDEVTIWYVTGEDVPPLLQPNVELKSSFWIGPLIDWSMSLLTNTRSSPFDR